VLGPGLLDQLGNPLINPCDGLQVHQGEIFDPLTTAGGCRKSFPTPNVLTSDPNVTLSTVAQNVLTFLPLPNAPGNQNGLVNNFIFNSSDPMIETTMTFRIDESVSEKNKMFFSYSSREQNQLNNTPTFPGPIDGTYKNHYLTHYLRYGWDYLASPSLLNHFVVGLNRLSTASIGSSVNGTDWPAKLGIGNAFGQVFPTFQFNGSPVSIPYSGLSAGNDDLHYPNSLVFADSISWTKGQHSFRFGGELRFFQFSVLAGGNTSPNYVFQNSETAWKANDQFTGDQFASFLLGVPQNESLTVNSHFPRWNQRYYALYVQDDFKFRRNLTLNLGVRWDVDTPRHEASGAQSVLSLTAQNPGTPGFPGALVFGKNATGTNTYFKDIAPRIGFAWSPNFVRDTVVRGAYSIYYAPFSYSDFGAFLTSGTTANPNFTSGDNFTPVQSLDAGFPTYTAPSNASDPTLLNFSQNGVNTVLPSYGSPGMVQNWDLEIQHQIMQDLILSVGYVGQHATRLNSGLAQVNTINPKFNRLGNALGFLVDGSDGNNGPAILAQLGVTVPPWFIPGWNDGVNNNGLDTIGNLLRPFPQFGDINTNCCHENLGQSTYNALQAKLERRFRNGLNLLASYTYSKTITDADGAYPFFSNLTSNVFGSQNPFNLRAEKAVSYQDVPHAFVLSYLYELPVGPGKRYLSHGVASKVLGGWQVGGVQRYQTGAPVLINEFATGLTGSQGGQYPGANYRYSLLPGQSLLVNNPGHWTPAADSTWNSSCPGGPNGTFLQASNPVVNCVGILDPSAASLAAGGGYVYGNLPQIISSWRSPSYLNEDFSVIKRTTIRESQAIVFKLDIPNAFNRHVFGQVDGNIFDRHFGVSGFGNFALRVLRLSSSNEPSPDSRSGLF